VHASSSHENREKTAADGLWRPLSPAGTGDLPAPSHFLRTLRPTCASRRQWGGGCAAFSEIRSEEFRKIAGRQSFPGIAAFLCERKLSTGAADEFLFVQLVKSKQELGLAVEARADAVEHGGDMLAQISPVGATARKLNLLWRGEQSIILSANSLPDSLENPPCTLQQLHQGINGPGTVLVDGFPARLAVGRDFHGDLIDGRTAHTSSTDVLYVGTLKGPVFGYRHQSTE
jgi:hypothetical protein